jgi:hypothetical protein
MRASYSDRAAMQYAPVVATKKGLERIKGWFRRVEQSVEDVAESGAAVATPPPGTSGDSDRETSTNAQTEGGVGQPWPGND